MAIRTDRGWLVLGYAGIGGFFAVEALARQPGSASSMEAAPWRHWRRRWRRSLGCE